ncbi:PAN domain-containing protein [Okeania sp. SIO2B3]|uniref:PAN domain-containing protein n=1 Tax=Okeania sp. SIO2B3 TaxID=2607784 RepID=UPI0013C07868|nr:PAN domain-containing protein [Okeania sp. SIO2B3]NET45922.1 hypothetical protein [Okeania sp. SIO2B3]
MQYLKNSFTVYGLALGIFSLTSTVALSSPRFIIDFNTDRIGLDYRNFNTNSMESCLRACATENQCRAFTYVPPFAQPGTPNAEGICWLKDRVPEASNNPGGMISGIKQ